MLVKALLLKNAGFFAKQVKQNSENWNPRFEENPLLAVSLVFPATNRKT